MIRHFIAATALALTVSALADDALKASVDPYDAADQKMKFFKAAGNDNELDAKEFAADQQAGGGLVQKFDKWDAAISFDKDGKGTLDWFELDAYRQALRKAVMTAFDKDKDGKLTGEERTAALKALADGKVPVKAEVVKTAEAPALPPGSGNEATKDGQATSRPASRPRGDGPERWMTPEQLKKYDKDGDGKINEEEQKAFFEDLRKEREKQMLDRYDKDKDGKLSDSERKAMERDMRLQRFGPMKDFALRNFDADGNGELDDKEMQAAGEFMKGMEKMAQSWQVLAFDKDGDGKVSDEEKRQAMEAWAPVGQRMADSMKKRIDTDGDGKTSAEEQKAFQAKMEKGMARWFTKYEKAADADKSGKLNEAERAAMIQGIDKDIRDRIKNHDDNKDGKLDPEEGEKVLNEVMDEMLKE